MKEKRARKYPRMKWTPENLAIVKEMTGRRCSAKEIADHFGVSRNAIDSCRHQYGIKVKFKFPKRGAAFLAQVIKFRMAGWALKDIARVLDTELSELSRLISNRGFGGKWYVAPKTSKKYRRWSEIEIARLRKSLHRKESFRKICEKFPKRSIRGIEKQIQKITRFWLSTEELAARKESLKKQLRVY